MAFQAPGRVAAERQAGGRITVEPRDAGTIAVKLPNAAPGMDEMYYREHRWEEDAFADGRDAQNADMASCAGNLALAPWPVPLPTAAPLDLTPRYHEGVKLQLHQATELLAQGDQRRFAEVPDGLGQILDPSVELPDPFDEASSHCVADLTPEEVRRVALEPTKWLRLPFRNETGGCNFKRPVWMRWDGLRGSEFAFELLDGLLFTPWDMRRASAYAWRDDEGSHVDAGEVFAQTRTRQSLVLYLRPRRWRYLIHVWAHFAFIQVFWEQLVDEEFLRVFYDRPPFYPVRHDVLHTAGEMDLWHDYEAAWLAWDGGIVNKVDGSLAAQALREEIVRQQYFDLCTIYALIEVEAAKVTVWADTPRIGEVVLGIGLRSPGLDVEKRVWAVQLEDASATYPRTVIGEFWCDFF